MQLIALAIVKKVKNDQLAPLSPVWTGTATALASLYGLWPAMGMLRGTGQRGEILFLLMFVGPITFFIVMIPATVMLCAIFRRIGTAYRSFILLVLAGLFLAVAGVPGLFGLSVVAVTAWLSWGTARKEQAIVRERDVFGSEGKPREVEIGPDFLAAFHDPLWSRLNLDDCKPLWAIEGVQDGAPYMIIEMSHAPFGLLANEHSQAKTTFILAAIPASISGRHVTWRPPGYQAWADSKYVYLAVPGKQAKPSAWRTTIAGAFHTVGALQQAAANAARPRAGARAYRAVGGGFAVQAFRCAKMLVLALALLWGGLAPMFGWMEFSAESVKMVPAYLLGSLFCLGGAWYFAVRAHYCWLQR